MLCGVWSRSPQRRREEMSRRAAAAAGRVELLSDGPLTLAADVTTRVWTPDLLSVVKGDCWAPERGADPGHRDPAGAEAAVGAFATHGAAGVAALEGQFSAIIWERDRGRLSLVGDHLARLGWHVLQQAGEILFATELRDLLPLARTRPGPDALALTMWLGLEGCPEGRTFFEGVRRLGPGEYFDCHEGDVRRRVAWAPRYEGTLRGGRPELGPALRRELQAAIWPHLVPGRNGVVLSGGIDSSVVTAVAAEGQDAVRRVRTYSSVFPGEPYDESAKVGALTRSLQLTARAQQPQPQGALWLAMRYLQQWQLPLVAPGALVEMSAVAAASQDHVDVLLDGQTGDEVLGFSPYVLADRLARARLPSAVRLLRDWPSTRDLAVSDRISILRHFGLKGLTPYRVGRYIRDHRDRSGHGPKWLVADRRRAFLDTEDAWAWKRRGSGPRWWRSMTDVLIWGPHRDLRLDYLRHRADAAGARWASPLYNERLIGFASRLPPEISFDPRFNRPLVREALADLLPDEVRLQVRKANFAAFAAATLRADAEGFRRLLERPRPEVGAFIDMDWIWSRWPSPDAAAEPSAALWIVLWRSAVVEAWLRAGSDPDTVTDLLEDPAILPPRSDPRILAAA